MSIIDRTYFQSAHLNIPNNTDINPSIPGVPTGQDDLQKFIDVYERLLLIDALGVTLYNELEAALQMQPFNPSGSGTAAQKWQDLVLGKDYEISGETYRWDGLRGFQQQSLVAFWVYCMYLLNHESTFTTNGIVRPDSANALNVSGNRKYNTAFRTFTEMYQGQYINSLISQNTFTNYRLTNRSFGLSFTDLLIGRRNVLLNRNIYPNNNSVRVSLYTYLIDQNELDETSFPDFDFRFYRVSNAFGI